MTDLGKLKAAGVTPIMFADGGLCNPSWFERLATSSLLASQVSQFDVNHAQVTTGLDVAVGIQKGIISHEQPRLRGGLEAPRPAWSSTRRTGQSSYDACTTPTSTTPPLSTQSLLVQGKVGILWGGSWYFPQLNSAGFTGKYGVFPEPPITGASTPARHRRLHGRHDRRPERQRPVGRHLAAGRQLDDPGQDRHRDELPRLAVHPAAPGQLDQDQPVRRRHPDRDRRARRSTSPA